MPVSYRTTNLAAWGTGLGRNLTAAEIDDNFWTLQTQINAIPTDELVSIDTITNPARNQLLITLTDATTRGPFTFEAAAPPTRLEVTTATRTLSLTDNWLFFDCANASGSAITVPDNAAVPFAINTTAMLFRHSAAGAVSFVPGPGVSIIVPDGMTAATAKKGDAVWLVKTATNTWKLHGDLARATQALAATGTVSLDPVLGDGTVTPTGDITINAASVIKGEWRLTVTTSGTTSYDITFGTNFQSQGVLATGTVTAKQFVIVFYGDGTTYREVSRTAAM